MKVAYLSDTHNKHNQINDFPAADVFVFAGDMSSLGYSKEIVNFSKWLSSLPYEYIIVIAGNHEVRSTSDEIREILSDFIYLDQEEVVINGIKFWGEPRTPEFGNWAFGVKRHLMGEECWSKVPDDVDVLISHGPPFGCGDKVVDWHSDDYIHVGCSRMRKMILDHKKISHVVCGHIHEGFGQDVQLPNGTFVHNACYLDGNYKPTGKIRVFEI